MPLIQVRNVSESTVEALKARAAEQRLTLAAYPRAELDRMASRPTNAQLVQRLNQRRTKTGPSTADTVREVRDAREVS
jgi:transposase